MPKMENSRQFTLAENGDTLELQVKLLNSKKQEKKCSFTLKRVSTMTLKKCREKGIPFFVIKKDGKYYCTRVLSQISFASCDILGEHKCVAHNGMCAHFSALSDENGGCEKVRSQSMGIENFPFIKVGYESVNTRQDILCVVECTNHKTQQPREKHTDMESVRRERALRESIEAFVRD